MIKYFFMEKNTKPKIGLLGLMTEGYEPVFPGIIDRQVKYAHELVTRLAPVADLDFPGPGLNRQAIEEKVSYFNEKKYDGILIILLAYSQGAFLLRALQNNRLPIALAIAQPDDEVMDDFEELDLTVNQGIHGAQDNSNVIVRSGFKCQFFAGSRHDQRFVDFTEDFARSAQTYTRLRKMKVAVIGRMQGMGDILADDMKFFSTVGTEICHDTIGSVRRIADAVSGGDIEKQIKKDSEIFELDPKLTQASHNEAVRIYLGFKRYLEEKGFGAFTAHFDVFGDDGRFKQLPLYAASQLMADGYGYAAEGDYICASMVSAAHTLGDGGGNFTEMYMMDFPKKAIIFCHAGEGNWATIREGLKPRLIDRYLGEGGLENPPTIMFTPRPGRSTLTSFAPMRNGKFRLVCAPGEILPKNDLKRCEMPYFFWRPDSGIEPCVEGWLRNGGTHHEVISLGDVRKRWRILCDLWDAEYAEV
jgi:L-arabinose isomerase